MAPEEVRITIFERWEMEGFLCSSGQLHIHVYIGSTKGNQWSVIQKKKKKEGMKMGERYFRGSFLQG